MIAMKVNGLAIDSASKMPVVILADSEEKFFLPIWIGVYEADAILIALEDIATPRPMPHELICNIFNTLNIKVDRIIINDIKDNTFFAKIHLIKEENENEYEIDSRPSDAIAIALRTGATIFVTEKVITEATVSDKEKCKKEIEEFKEFLKTAKPSDFMK